MKVAFISNFLNHHVIPICEKFANMSNVDFIFIATEKIPEERINMGYISQFDNYKYFFEAIEQNDRLTAEKICYERDVVILGNAPLYFVKRRLKDKKIVFNYSERWFRSGFLNHPGDVLRAFTRFTLTKNKNFFQLCASAFAANDCRKVFAFPNRKFRWGYFPKAIKHNVELILEKKEQFSIIWVGRLISCKHPELAIDIAENLVKEGYDFNLKIIGVGELESEISNSIILKGLSDKVKMLGKMTPEDVRDNMEKSQLFLFTSDKGEGWGAVLNEAMNSACAVIASDAIGPSS